MTLPLVYAQARAILDDPSLYTHEEVLSACLAIVSGDFPHNATRTDLDRAYSLLDKVDKSPS